MNDKIDRRLVELQIDRGPEPAGQRRWPGVLLILLGLVVLVSISLWILSPKTVSVTVETVRLIHQAAPSAACWTLPVMSWPGRQAVFSSKVPGKILEVLVEEGVRVVKDQIIAYPYLDNSSQTAQLRLAQAQHRSAESALNEIRAQLRQAELDLTRATELLARNLASQAEFDAATANAETAIPCQRSTREVSVRLYLMSRRHPTFLRRD